MKNHITVESFGSEVPMNWEEIAAYLNTLIDEKIEASGMDPDPVPGSEEARDLHDLIDSVWNAYWNGEYNDAPAARTGEEDKMETMVENASGSMVDFEAAVPLMDDAIRERLHAQLAPCSPQEFFTAYEEAHEQKDGEEWELSKYNPVF